MKNQETGEFELVLGNRQLLSGFFLVVILFGVFFTMGYIVGRNSAPSPKLTAAADAYPNQPGVPVETATRPAADPPPPPSAHEETQTAARQPAPEAAPAQTAPPPRTREAARPAESAPPDGIIEPAPGDVYLQVMAVKRPEAEVVLKTLRDKGFRAVLGQGPNELVRVLVGPLSDAAAIGQTKAGLENAGFHPIVRK